MRYVCDLTMQNGSNSFSLVADTPQRQLGTPIRTCHIILFKQIVVSCRVLSSPSILALELGIGPRPSTPSREVAQVEVGSW